MTPEEARTTDLYDKHFSVNEPEDHYNVSVQFALRVLDTLYQSADSIYDFPHKINLMKEQLEQELINKEG